MTYEKITSVRNMHTKVVEELEEKLKFEFPRTASVEEVTEPQPVSEFSKFFKRHFGY